MRRLLSSLLFVMPLAHSAWATPDLNLVSGNTSGTVPDTPKVPQARSASADAPSNFTSTSGASAAVSSAAPLTQTSTLGTPMLNIVSGAANVTFSGVGSQVLYANDINGWNVSLILGLSNSPALTGTNGGYGLQLTSASATCFGGGCSTDPLDIYLSDTGFTQPTPDFNTYFSSTQTGVGTSSQMAWFDPSNTLFGTSTAIATVGSFTGLGAFAGSGSGPGPGASSSAGPSPYALTIEDIFNPNGGAASFGATGDITAAPEPSSLILFGTLLLLYAFTMRRSKIPGSR